MCDADGRRVSSICRLFFPPAISTRLSAEAAVERQRRMALSGELVPTCRSKRLAYRQILGFVRWFLFGVIRHDYEALSSPFAFSSLALNPRLLFLVSPGSWSFGAD